MKPMALVFAFVAIPLLAQAGDYEITVDRKKDALSAPQGEYRQVATQNWTGEVKIQNHAFNPSPELEARYIIFVKRQKIGQKQGMDQIEKVKGTTKVPAIKPGATAVCFTSDVPLHKAHMAPGWVPAEGGQQTAEDGVLGIWLKLYSGTTPVAEYVNPTTLATKFKWE
jgi:hypothetical protein